MRAQQEVDQGPPLFQDQRQSQPCRTFGQQLRRHVGHRAKGVCLDDAAVRRDDASQAEVGDL